MKKYILLTLAVAFSLLLVLVLAPTGQADEKKDKDKKDFDPPMVFQAAGPTPKDADEKTITDAIQGIQGTVDAFRAALGEPNNANAPGPLATGRREINWDGGGNNDTTDTPVTPFNVFLNTRGGQFTTLGTGLVLQRGFEMWCNTAPEP